MFVGGIIRFKPPLKTQQIQTLQQNFIDDFILYNKDMMEMGCPFNWEHRNANIVLMDFINELKQNGTKLYGYLLVIHKNPNNNLELLKYVPMSGTLKAIPGYFHLVRRYSKNLPRPRPPPHPPSPPSTPSSTPSSSPKNYFTDSSSDDGGDDKKPKKTEKDFEHYFSSSDDSPSSSQSKHNTPKNRHLLHHLYHILFLHLNQNILPLKIHNLLL